MNQKSSTQLFFFLHLILVSAIASTMCRGAPLRIDCDGNNSPTQSGWHSIRSSDTELGTPWSKAFPGGITVAISQVDSEGNSGEQTVGGGEGDMWRDNVVGFFDLQVDVGGLTPLTTYPIAVWSFDALGIDDPTFGSETTWNGNRLLSADTDPASLRDHVTVFCIQSDASGELTFDGESNAGSFAVLLHGFEIGDPAGSTDRDGDGLCERAEALLGSDPLNIDSDFDLVSDGLEVEWGSDPTDQYSLPPWQEPRPVSGGADFVTVSYTTNVFSPAAFMTVEFDAYEGAFWTWKGVSGVVADFLPAGEVIVIPPAELQDGQDPRIALSTIWDCVESNCYFDQHPTLRRGEHRVFRLAPVSDRFDLWSRMITPNPDPGDDPELDGLPALLEYAFGLCPSIYDNFPVEPLTGRMGIPTVVDSDDGLELAYVRRRGSSGIDYIPQYSTDLTEWLPIEDPETTELINPSWDLVRVPIAPPAGARSVFTRVTIQFQ